MDFRGYCLVVVFVVGLVLSNFVHGDSQCSSASSSLPESPSTNHSGHRVLWITVSGANYNAQGDTGYTWVRDYASAKGAVVDFHLLDATHPVSQSLASYNQIWIYDLSTFADDYPSSWQNIANWWSDTAAKQIICDGRIISSFWNGHNEKQLIYNYYENLYIRGGGLMLSTDHDVFHTGTNTLLGLMNFKPFTGNFQTTKIPADKDSILLSWPVQATHIDNAYNPPYVLWDDSSPGSAPFNLQPNGLVLYAVAWHSSNQSTPGISSTIRGTIGFLADIPSPVCNATYLQNFDPPINFTATTQRGQAPFTYKWKSDVYGEFATTGPTVMVPPNIFALGQHVITVTVTDNTGTVAVANVRIYIAEKPCTGPGNVAIASRSSKQYYAAGTVPCGQTCQSEQRYCTDGSLNGTFTSLTCSVTPCPCTGPDNQMIPHGESRDYFSLATVPCDSVCVPQSRECNNGVLSGNANLTSCSVEPCPCIGPNEETIPHGESRQYYQDLSVACGDQCVSQTRTCDDGNLSGEYQNSVCQYDGCNDIYVDGQTGQDVESCGSDESEPCKTVDYAFSQRSVLGTTIHLSPSFSGVYHLSSTLVMDDQLSVSFSGSGIFNCSGLSNAVVINAPPYPVTFSGVTFVGCSDSAVVISGSGSVTFTNVRFENNGLNGATRGGAVNVVVSIGLTLSFINCDFVGNEASGEGGAVYYSENNVDLVQNERIVIQFNQLSFEGCSFENNRADIGGAILLETNGGSVTLNQTVFQANVARYLGSALSSIGPGALRFIDTAMLDNYCLPAEIMPARGITEEGGIFDVNGATTVAIEGQFGAATLAEGLPLSEDRQTTVAFTQVSGVQFQEDFTAYTPTAFSESTVIFAKQLKNERSIKVFTSQVECDSYNGATGSYLSLLEQTTLTSNEDFEGDGEVYIDESSSLIIRKSKKIRSKGISTINGDLKVTGNIVNAGSLAIESTASVSVLGDVQNDGKATVQGGLTVSGNYNNTGETVAKSTRVSVGKDINNKGSITASSTQLEVGGYYHDTGNGEAVLVLEQETSMTVNQNFTINGNTTVDVPSIVTVGKSVYNKQKGKTSVKGSLSAAESVVNDGNLSSSGNGASVSTKNMVTSSTGKTSATAGATLAVSQTLSNQGEVQIDSSASVTALDMVNEGTLSVSGGNSGLAVAGNVTNKGKISVDSGATVAVAGSLANVGNGAQVEVKGISELSVEGKVTNDKDSTVSLTDGATLTVNSALENTGRVEIRGSKTVLSVVQNFENDGTISSDSGSKVAVGSNLVNRGALEVSGNATQLNIAGSFENKEGATTTISGGGQLQADDIQQEGQLNVDQDNGIKTSSLRINGLFVVGTDSFTTTATILTLPSNVVLGSSAVLKFDIAGNVPGDNLDQIAVVGAMTLDGELLLHVVPPYKLQNGVSVDIMSFTNYTGSLRSVRIDSSAPSCVQQSATPVYNPTMLSLTISVVDNCPPTLSSSPISTDSANNNKNEDDKSNSNRNAAIAAPVIGGVLLIAALLAVVYYRRKQHNGGNNEVELSQIAVGGESTANSKNNKEDESNSQTSESDESTSDDSSEQTSTEESSSEEDSSESASGSESGSDTR